MAPDASRCVARSVGRTGGRRSPDPNNQELCMRKLPVYAALASGSLVVIALGSTLPGAAAATHGSSGPAVGTVRVCPPNPRPGFATCLAVAVAGADGTI